MAVAVWHDTSRGVDASRTRKVVYPGRHVHEPSPTGPEPEPLRTRRDVIPWDDPNIRNARFTPDF